MKALSHRVTSMIRYFLFPQSKVIQDRTQEIDKALSDLKMQKAKTKEAIQRVNQPDVLRALVLSMSHPEHGQHK